jgi:hypothetical protein
MARYLRHFMGWLLGGLTLLAALNLVADPYATFRWADIPGVNQVRNLKDAHAGGRVSKSVILARHRFDAVFLGTSRAETGLSPRSPALGGLRAFNAALPYTNMAELTRVARFVAEHQRPKLVVIGLDYDAFGPETGNNADFPDSLFAGRPLAPLLFERLLSWRSTRDALGVLRASATRQPARYAKEGNYEPPPLSAAEQRGKIADILTHHRERLAAHRHAPERIAELGRAVEALRATGSRVLLFISPVHRDYTTLALAGGAGPDMERWRRGLEEMAAGTGAELWDFSVSSPVTTEPPPAADGPPMRWYWEPSHYTRATGELVLARMLGRGDAVPGGVPEGFGRRLR